MGKTKTVIIGEVPESEKNQEEIKKESQKERYLKKKAKKEKKEAPAENAELVEEKKEAIAEIKTEKQEPTKKDKLTTTKRKKRSRSSKYQAISKLVDKTKPYLLDEAISLVKKTSYTKFDATIEMHISTISKKGQDQLRGLVSLPSGSPKQKKIVIADEPLIDKIKAGKIEFDVLISTPDMMPKLAQVAKILGPKGLMPSPKSGTVTDDVEKVKEELSSGKIEYKTDPLGNIHTAVGKISWDNEKISANIKTLLHVIPQNRIKRVTLCATIGPSVQITV